jgi:ketosteroid isomerase-like protein
MAYGDREALLGAAFLLLAACGTAPTGNAPQAVETPAGYQEAAAALDAAIAGKDRRALESLIADDFLWIRGSGVKGGKTGLIKALTADTIRIEPFRPSEVRWIVTGNAALLAATNELRGVSDGEPFVDRHRFADHWLWRDRRWRLVYAQVTPVASQR